MKDSKNEENIAPLSFFNKMNNNVFEESNNEENIFDDNPNTFSDNINSPNTHDAFNSVHNHCLCNIHDHDCECGCDHEHAHENKNKKQNYPMYDLDEDFDESADYYCDIDPTKICDNCGKCLDSYNTDKRGYVNIPIDHIETNNNDVSLDDLLKLYGLDDD